MLLSYEQVSILAKSYNTIPLYRVLVNSDSLTPISAFLKLRQRNSSLAKAGQQEKDLSEDSTSNYEFLFESVLGGEKIGRYASR